MTKRASTYWETLHELFHGALELPAEQRPSWLEARCANAPELVREVLELLANHDSEDCRIGQAVSETARDIGGTRGNVKDRRLGAYRILEHLGQGGMGTVYLAERDDEAYRQKVAIKLIRGFPGDEALERMRRERQILADLNHPHIARLLDGGNTEDGQPYLVMEYVDGVPIVEWCREYRLERNQRIHLMLDICDAVHYAHQHLVIHRDIKPGNVLVTEDAAHDSGPGGRPVLLDFGIAKFITEPGSETVQTARFYTPGYASPEQLAGKPVTTMSDVYSLGRLLLAVLDVKDLETDGDRETVFRKAAWQRRLPRDLAAIAAQATRVEPERRYSSVASLRADLVNYLEGRAVDAVPSRFGYRLGKFVRRRRAAVAAVTLAMVIGVGLVSQWVSEYERARVAEAAASLEAEHARQVLDFLLDTIGAASPQQARGEDITVRQVVERGHRGLMASPDIDPAIQGRLLLALGEVYQHLEAWDDADELLRHAAHADEPEIRARALSLLGFVRILQQRYDQAREPLEQGLALAESHSGLNPETILQLRNHWGLWLLHNGQAEAARDLFGEVIDAHRAAGRNTDVARIKHNLALAERALGNIGRTTQLLRESLAIKAETIGRGDPSYARGLQLLAVSLRQIGDYEGAREMIAESLQTRIELFGDDHPGLHSDYNELANAYHDLGDYDRAIELYLKTLDLLPGTGGVDRAVYLNNMGAALEDRGDWQQATALYRESLEMRREALGDNHLSVATALHNLARNLVRIGQLEEAESLIREALVMRTTLLGGDHQAALYTRALYGTLAYSRGNWAAAEQIQRESLESLEQRLPDASLWVLNVRGELARTLIEQGELDEAARLLEETVARYHLALTEAHPHAASLEVELARIELLRGRLEHAEARLTAVAHIVEQRLSPESMSRRQLECVRAGETGRSCWTSID